MNVPPDTIRFWESGRVASPDPVKLKALCEVLDQPHDEALAALAADASARTVPSGAVVTSAVTALDDLVGSPRGGRGMTGEQRRVIAWVSELMPEDIPNFDRDFQDWLVERRHRRERNGKSSKEAG